MSRNHNFNAANRSIARMTDFSWRFEKIRRKQKNKIKGKMFKFLLFWRNKKVKRSRTNYPFLREDKLLGHDFEDTQDRTSWHTSNPTFFENYPKCLVWIFNSGILQFLSNLNWPVWCLVTLFDSGFQNCPLMAFTMDTQNVTSLVMLNETFVCDFPTPCNSRRNF